MSTDLICWKRIADIADEMTPREHRWLAHVGSLTKRLRRVGSGDIEHRVRYEAWELPQADEAAYLGVLTTERWFIRETDWYYQGHRGVMTRALISATAEQAPGECLHTIGTRSLGDLLFADPNLTRSPFEFARLMIEGKNCWARRSIFFYFGKPLLVKEVFFPSMLGIDPPNDE